MYLRLQTKESGPGGSPACTRRSRWAGVTTSHLPLTARRQSQGLEPCSQGQIKRMHAIHERLGLTSGEAVGVTLEAKGGQAAAQMMRVTIPPLLVQRLQHPGAASKLPIH